MNTYQADVCHSFIWSFVAITALIIVFGTIRGCLAIVNYNECVKITTAAKADATPCRVILETSHAAR